MKKKLYVECDLVCDVFVDGLIFNLADLRFSRRKFNEFFFCFGFVFVKYPLVRNTKWHQ